MKKRVKIADRLARRNRLTDADAADQLDRMVHDILQDLKRGRTVPFPGLGTFEPGKQTHFRFERPGAPRKRP